MSSGKAPKARPLSNDLKMDLHRPPTTSRAEVDGSSSAFDLEPFKNVRFAQNKAAHAHCPDAQLGWETS